MSCPFSHSGAEHNAFGPLLQKHPARHVGGQLLDQLFQRKLPQAAAPPISILPTALDQFVLKFPPGQENGIIFPAGIDARRDLIPQLRAQQQRCVRDGRITRMDRSKAVFLILHKKRAVLWI